MTRNGSCSPSGPSLANEHTRAESSGARRPVERRVSGDAFPGPPLREAMADATESRRRVETISVRDAGAVDVGVEGGDPEDRVGVPQLAGSARVSEADAALALGRVGRELEEFV